MKLVVLDDNYPNLDNLYGDVFAHDRVKEYKNKYSDITVLAHYNNDKIKDYIYEGIKVVSPASLQEVGVILNKIQPDLVLVHFATIDIIQSVILKYTQYKYIVWVHGFEALSFVRRRFNYDFKKVGQIRNFFRYGMSNAKQLYAFRKLIQHSNRDKSDTIHFVFVSDWMKRVCEKDCLIKMKSYSIIPNPINTELFEYVPMDKERLFNILMIRPFHSKKYATDIMSRVIIKLSELEIFNKIRFTIVGDGVESTELFSRFHQNLNFTFINSFLTHNEIRKLHQSHGVFFSLTRQDAQGVSMCEALSSGMLVISSRNTAIPEFIEDGFSGILTNNLIKNVLDKLLQVYSDFDRSYKIAHQASISIKKIADTKFVIDRELKLIEKIKNENIVYTRN